MTRFLAAMLTVVLAAGCTAGESDAEQTTTDEAVEVSTPDADPDADPDTDDSDTDEGAPEADDSDVDEPADLPIVLSGTPPPGIDLLTAEAGGGPRPELAWAAVDGAATYDVTLFAPSGRGYWAWAGAETAVHVGGAPLDDGAPGPALVDGMAWQVGAYDASGILIGLSERRPIAP